MSDKLTEMQQQLAEIEQQLTEMRQDLAIVFETINKAETVIARVGDEVMPTLDKIIKSPMLKMLGVK